MDQVGLDPAEGVQTESPGLWLRYKSKVQNRRSHIHFYTTKVTQEHWEPGHPMAPALIAVVWNSPIPADESLATKGEGDEIYENRYVQDCTEHTLLAINVLIDSET